MWILLTAWTNAFGNRVVTVITSDDDMPHVFDTLESAKACAAGQMMCKAYGALAVDMTTGDTEWIW